MGNQIELLVDLQVIDRELRKRDEAIAELRGAVEEIDGRIAAERQALGVCDTERDPLDTRRREIEAVLSDESEKMTERRFRLNRVRTEKEAAAINREIEVAKEETETLEEELLGDEGLYALLKVLNERRDEILKAIEELESKREGAQKQADEEIAEISKSMEADQARRESVASTLETSLRRRYENIFQKKRGLAVVEIEDGACVGCHMSVSPQLANEIRKNQSVHTCPSCHRILYFKPEPAEGDEA